MSSSGSTSQSADNGALPIDDTSQTPLMSQRPSSTAEHQRISPSPLHQNNTMPPEKDATVVEGDAVATLRVDTLRRYDIEKLMGLAYAIQGASANVPVATATALRKVARGTLDWVIQSVQNSTSETTADEHSVDAVRERIQLDVAKATEPLEDGQRETVRWLCSRPAEVDHFGNRVVIIQSTQR